METVELKDLDQDSYNEFTIEIRKVLHKWNKEYEAFGLFFALINFSFFKIFFQIEKEDVNVTVKEKARADSEVRILKMLQNRMAEAKEE